MTAAVARRYGDRLLAAVAQRPNGAEDVISAYRSAFRAAFDRDGRMCLCGALGAEAGVLSREIAEEIISFSVGALMIYRSGSAAPERKREPFT
jgi:TetR/AcrR family transcriptional repressor of nem operon